MKDCLTEALPVQTLIVDLGLEFLESVDLVDVDSVGKVQHQMPGCLLLCAHGFKWLQLPECEKYLHVDVCAQSDD